MGKDIISSPCTPQRLQKSAETKIGGELMALSCARGGSGCILGKNS